MFYIINCIFFNLEIVVFIKNPWALISDPKKIDSTTSFSWAWKEGSYFSCLFGECRYVHLTLSSAPLWTRTRHSHVFTRRRVIWEMCVLTKWWISYPNFITGMSFIIWTFHSLHLGITRFSLMHISFNRRICIFWKKNQLLLKQKRLTFRPFELIN